MHFPWKKSKVARISRLVAGLHQSPKRGGSLVVETGFPTSLVDLFVKNSDRLRKSSKRRCNSSSSPRILAPLTTPPLSRSPCNDNNLQSPGMDSGENKNDERIPFHVAFQVSLVVALAVSTRGLAIWILMAALLLVLIKFTGARFWGFLRPDSNTLFFCSGIPKGLKSRVDESVVKHQGTTDPCDLIELEIGNETCKSEHSRSSRIKTSLIKKLVPKKLRHGKRKKQGKSNDNKEKEPSRQLEKEKEKQEPGVGGEDGSETEQGEMVSTFGQLFQVESEWESDRKGNPGYVILFVIILAGLTGGRGVALLLTLVCCSILMYIGTHKEK